MTEQQTSNKKLNPVVKWLNMLMGKPVAKDIPVEVKQSDQPTQSQPAAPTVTPPINPTVEEAVQDSITADFEKVQKVAQKVFKTASIKATPLVNKGKAESAVLASSAGKVIDTSFLRKAIKMLIVILVLMVIVFMAIKIFPNKIISPAGEISPTKEEISGQTESLAPIDYHQYIDSIYATDPEVLRVEESIKVLDREINNIQYKDPALNPPSIDFDVSF